MITYMTPSRVEFEYEGQSYTVHGEALDPAYGLDYVIYAHDFHFTDKRLRNERVDPLVRRGVLNGIAAELTANGTRFEIDSGDDVAPAETQQVGVVAPAPAPAAGFWFTPARTNSRRYFVQGEPMPDVGGDYGTTIWQWDNHQS